MLVATVVYKFLRSKVFVARRVARSSVSGLSKLALRSIAAIGAAIIRRESHENLVRVSAISGSRTAEGGTRPGARCESINRVAALRTACSLLLPDPKRRLKQPQQAQSRSHERSHSLPPAAEAVGQSKCQKAGPSLSGPAPTSEIFTPPRNGSPSLSLGRRSDVGSLDSGPGSFGTSDV